MALVVHHDHDKERDLQRSLQLFKACKANGGGGAFPGLADLVEARSRVLGVTS